MSSALKLVDALIQRFEKSMSVFAYIQIEEMAEPEYVVCSLNGMSYKRYIDTLRIGSNQPELLLDILNFYTECDLFEVCDYRYNGEDLWLRVQGIPGRLTAISFLHVEMSRRRYRCNIETSLNDKILQITKNVLSKNMVS